MIAEPQVIKVGDKRLVVLDEEDYQRLVRESCMDLPELPPADADGNRPAAAFAKATIARNLILDRKRAGFTQGQLAKLSGVTKETICRAETGKNSPTPATIGKLYAVLDPMI